MLNPELCYLAWQIELATEASIEEIKNIFVFIEDESEIKITEEICKVEKTPCDDHQNAIDDIIAQNFALLQTIFEQLKSATTPDQFLLKNCLRILKTIHKAVCEKGYDDELVSSNIHLIEKLTLDTKASGEEIKKELLSGIENVLKALKKVEPNIHPQLSEAEVGENKNNKEAKISSVGLSGTGVIKVEQEKIERLMRVAGELLVMRNSLPLFVKKVEGIFRRELKEITDQISHIADEIQDAVLSIRMLPVRTLFQRFPRMVRDLSQKMGKEIVLRMEGEDTEFDKAVLEQLGDPLVHIIRNAIDHGIEPAEERMKSGKPRIGTILLKAYNKGANVVIEISDDGRGLDHNKLIKKAVAKGLISESYAKTLSQEAAFELIFLPGFSTAEEISEVSGRGVGMDVVRTAIRKLRGRIEIASQHGKGTTFFLIMPSSMLISRSLLVEVSNSYYAIPIEQVIELIKVPQERIQKHRNEHFFSWRDSIYDVIYLADFLDDWHTTDKHISSASKEISIAIVDSGDNRLGLAVNKFIGEVDIIIKPLMRGLTKENIFLGSAILGNGDVVLVINPAELCRALFNNKRLEKQERNNSHVGFTKMS